jgi:hypothetical protein
MEDMVEIEKRRAGKDNSRSDYPMTFSDGSRILNAAILVMKILGWAWRWAELWVDYNSSWEPLLEPGQNERKMTKEQLKIIDSTRESRCADARRCRLAAFGAALRNRNYDTPEGFNQVALDRALRAILHTKSLVGPLEGWEIDFFVEWLGRAYRSKSRLLGFGEDRIPISGTNEYCVFKDSQTPKFELGDRTLPGLQELPEGTFFEVDICEPDDFLLQEILADSNVPPLRLRDYKSPAITDSYESASSTKSIDVRKRRPGRPPKKSRLLEESGKDSEASAQQGSDFSLGICSSVKLESAVASERSRLIPDKRAKVFPSDESKVPPTSSKDGTMLNTPVKRGRGRPKKIRTPEDTRTLVVKEPVSAEAKTTSKMPRLSDRKPSRVDRHNDTHETQTSKEQGYAAQQDATSEVSSPSMRRRPPRKKARIETIRHESSVAETPQDIGEIDVRGTTVSQKSSSTDLKHEDIVSDAPKAGPSILATAVGFETKSDSEDMASKNVTTSTMQADDKNDIEVLAVAVRENEKEDALSTKFENERNLGRVEATDQSSQVLLASSVKLEAVPDERTEGTNVAPSASGSGLSTDYPVHAAEQTRTVVDLGEPGALSGEANDGAVTNINMTSKVCETESILGASDVLADNVEAIPLDCNKVLSESLEENFKIGPSVEVNSKSQSSSINEIKVEMAPNENLETQEFPPFCHPPARKRAAEIPIDSEDPTKETNLEVVNAYDQVKRRRRNTAHTLVMKTEKSEATQQPLDESVERSTRRTRSRGRSRKRRSLQSPTVDEEDGLSIAELVARRKPPIPSADTRSVHETAPGSISTEMAFDKMDDGTASESTIRPIIKEEVSAAELSTTAPQDHPGSMDLRSNDASTLMLMKDDASSSPQKLGRLRGKKLAESSFVGTLKKF